MTPLARAEARCRDLRASCDTNQVGAAEDIEPALELLEGAIGALRYARPIIERWCHTQGNNFEFFERTLAPIDKVLARLDAGKEGGDG